MTQFDQIVHAAIDVSKTHLDLYCPEIGTRRFSNTPEGIRDLMRLLAGMAVTRIEMEATGGYERALKRSAWQSGLEVCLVNALRVRQFARSQGLLAKTDQIDARVIHHYGQLFAAQLRVCAKPSSTQELMAAYVLRRHQLSVSLCAEKNRLEKATLPIIARLIRVQIVHLEKAIAQIDAKLRQLIDTDAALQKKEAAMRQLDGVGPVVSATLLALMPELGRMNRKEAASLAGVAPINHDSGQMRGERHIQAGRLDVRRVLYMAVLTAIRLPGKYRDRFAALQKRGKAPKVALTACMRVLIIEINASLRGLSLSSA